MMAMMRGGRGGGRGGGSIVKPGQQSKSPGGTPRGGLQGIGKKAGNKGGKARQVVIGGAQKLAGAMGRAPGGKKGKGGKAGGGAKNGNKKGGKGNTLAAKFAGR